MKKIAALLFVIFVFICLLTSCNPDAKEVDWNDIVLGSVLPKPQSNLINIIFNDDADLSVYVFEISQSQYSEYRQWCEQEKGFNIEIETIGDSFYAYNEEGYYLSLLLYESQEKMQISLTAPVSMEAFELPDYVVTAGLPIPESKIGHFNWRNEDGFSLYVGETNKDNYMLYKDACVVAGFNIDPYEYNTVYSATNKEGYKVSLNYKGFNTFSLEFKVPNDGNNEKNDVDEESPSTEYTLDYSDAASFETALNKGKSVKGAIVQFEVNKYEPDSFFGINCWAGEHLNFILEEELDVGAGNVIVGRVTSEPTKFLGSWEIHYEVLFIGGEKIVEETTESQKSDKPIGTQSTEIVLTMSHDDFKGMGYKEAETLLREMGFTKFKYKTVETKTESASNTICYIEIIEWLFGDSNFVKGDKFDVDSTVTLYSYKYEAPAAPSPVFYSTNDYETARKGNSGVFSYRERGNSYDIYWIINFDEGCVYNFTDGNGELSCDRIKIVSGTLNDSVTITYHDGGDVWSYKLHFKYTNQPETLIMVDQNGFDWKYSTTDLDDALDLMATKTIKDY